MAKIIHLITRKETLKVNDKGQIGGGENKVTFSDGWRMVGAVEFRFGRVSHTYTMEQVRAGTVPWKYKNGKQRAFVKDYDHGSHRIQMSPSLLDVMITEEKVEEKDEDLGEELEDTMFNGDRSMQLAHERGANTSYDERD